MSSQFTAFDVTVGNCFLMELERANPDDPPFRVLVDTGKYAKETASFLKSHLGLTAGSTTTVLEVVTVTHTDADHLDGLSGVMDLDVKIPELWLPYLTAKATYMAFKDPVAIADASADLVEKLSEQAMMTGLERIASFDAEVEERNGEDAGSQVAARPYLQLGMALIQELQAELRESAVEVGRRPQLDPPESITVESLLHQLSNVDEERDHWSRSADEVIFTRLAVGRRWPHFLFPDPMTPREAAELLVSIRGVRSLALARGAMVAAMCSKAHKVKEAVIQACRKRKDMNVRFFEYADQLVSSQPHLKPPLPIGVINAKEIRHIQAGIDPGTVLALIPHDNATNHTSLVLYAPATSRYPAALLSADSDFAFAETPPHLTWTPNMLITAPHHGSPRNGGLASLYIKARKANSALSSVWVRSDKSQKASSNCPAPWWRVDLNSSVGVTRYCTCCWKAAKTKSNHVVLTATTGQSWSTANQACQC